MAPARYDPVYQTLHWVVAALVGVQFFTKLASPGSFAGVTEAGLNRWHLAVGPTILLLMLVRFGWRLTHAHPPPPADLPQPLRVLSVATHRLLYALLIVTPLLGWVSASGYAARPSLFFLVPLPLLSGHDERLGGAWGEVHGWFAWALLAVIALHVAAACWHGLARDDGVFARMMPGGGAGT